MGYLQEFFRPKIFKYKYTKNSVIHGIPRPVFCISGWLRRPKICFCPPLPLSLRENTELYDGFQDRTRIRRTRAGRRAAPGAGRDRNSAHERIRGAFGRRRGDTRRMRRTAGRRSAGRHRDTLPRHVGRLQGHRLENTAPKGCCANGDTKSGMSIVRSGCNGPNCGRISTPCAPRWPVQWA